MGSGEYDRGIAEGMVQARLDEHARRLDVVNGHMAVVAKQLIELTAAVTELTRVATSAAAASEKYVPVVQALEQRRTLGLKRWQLAAAALALLAPQLLSLALHATRLG